MRNRESGFTIIELLMVILLVSILSGVAIPQFLDFRTEARDAATQSVLGALRTAIANQTAQLKIRCNAQSSDFPSLASLNANNVVVGGDCTAGQVINTSERQFIGGPNLPGNPWGPNQAFTVTACVGAGTGCNQIDATACNGAAYTAASDGWCYNPATGEIWANSRNSTGLIFENTF